MKFSIFFCFCNWQVLEYNVPGGKWKMVQSNLDYPDLDYPDFSIIRTFSLVPFFSRILISFDLKSFQK